MSHIEEYMKRETPEMKKARYQKASEARRMNRVARETSGNGFRSEENISKSSIARAGMNGIRVNLCQVVKGGYEKGSSRTILVQTKSFSGTTDELRDELVRFIQGIKSGRRNVQSRVVMI